MKNKTIILLAFISSILFITCTKDDDKALTDSPKTDVNSGETSKDYYEIERIKHLYPTIGNDFTKVVFKNSNNDNKSFSLTYVYEILEQSGGTATEEHKGETFKTQYSLDSLENENFHMSFNLYSSKSKSSEQVVEIIYGGLYPTSITGLIASFDIVDSDLPFLGSSSTFEESKTLLDKSFTDVYTNLEIPANPTSFNQIHFNPEFGIIGFTDGQGDLWVYDSMK